MSSNTLLMNYRKSLEQKYNAVCFDIDGTLTIKGSKTIDNRAIDMIIDLLKKKIPVVFITGRGEKGLTYLKKDIYDRLRNSENITDSDMKRIYALTNDGARLFTTTSKSQGLFNKREYLASEETLKSLADFNLEILNILIRQD